MAGPKTFKYDEGLEERDPLWKRLGYDSLYTRDPVEAFGAVPKIKSGLSEDEKRTLSPEKIADNLYYELDALFDTDEKVVLDLLNIIAPFNSPSYKIVNKIYIEKYGLERGNRSLIEDIIFELNDTPYRLERALHILDFDATDILRKYMLEENKNTAYLAQAMRRSEIHGLEYQERLDLLYFVSEQLLINYTSLIGSLRSSNKQEILILNIIDSFSEDEKVILYSILKRGHFTAFKEFRDKDLIFEPEKKREGISKIEESEALKEVKDINEECEDNKVQIDDDLQEEYENKFRDLAIPYLHQLLNISEQSAAKEGMRYALEERTVRNYIPT